MSYFRKRRRVPRNPKTHEASVEVRQDAFKSSEDAGYADALLALFSRSNTILTGREIQCALSDEVQIAATDGSTIYFNLGQISRLIRGLRISRRVPDEKEYSEACHQILHQNWIPTHNLPWSERYNHYHASKNYLWKVWEKFPELFPQKVFYGSGQSEWNWSDKLPYAEFCKQLVRKEMGESIRSFASLRGLNYHELSHCLFTPSANTAMRRSALQGLCSRHTTDLPDDKILALIGLTPQQAKKVLAAKSKHPVGYSSLEQAIREQRNDEWTNKYNAVISLLTGSTFWHKMWNTLEDQRIESLFVAKFPTARHFFTTIVLRYIAIHNPKKVDPLQPFYKDTAKKGGAYLLIHGRRYLPLKLRNQYRQYLVDDYQLSDKQVKEMELLIDQFRSLSSFRSENDMNIATDIIWKFGLWVVQNTTDISNIPEPDGGFDHDRHGKTGQVTKREQAESQQQREKQEEEWEEQDSNSDDSDDSDDADDSDENSDTDGDADSEEDSEDSDSDSDDSDDDAETGDSQDESSQSEQGHGEDSKNGRHQDSTSQSPESGGITASANKSDDSVLRGFLNEAEQAINEDAIRQIESLHELVKKNRASRFFRELHKPDTETEPPVLFRSLSNAISNSLAKLRSDRDNQWEKGSSTGVVNVLRYAEARGTHTDFFDEWQEDGDERPDAEVCVLLDLSTSMNSQSFTSAKARHEAPKDDYGVSKFDYATATSNAQEASFAMWAIKNACQKNDILCSVIGYSDKAYPLYAPDDTVLSGQAPVFNGLDGTHPTEALLYAESVLEKSEAKHRILISLSDGDWTISHQGLRCVEKLRKNGVQTVFIQLPCRVDFKSQGQGLPPVLIPSYSDLGSRVTGKGFYYHEHLLQVEDSSVLTKKIGAILLQAVR